MRLLLRRPPAGRLRCRQTAGSLVALAVLLVAGEAGAQPFTFELRRTDLANASYGRAFPADLDRDGDADLVVSGAPGSSAQQPSVYLARYGEGSFAGTEISFAQDEFDSAVWLGDGAWHDANRDGRPDLVLIGASDMSPGALGRPGSARTTLYVSDQEGVLRPTAAGLPDRYAGCVAWADPDLDGDPDLLIAGLDPAGVPRADVYVNRGNGQFDAMGAGLPQLALCDAAWADVDSDGDPDLALSGADADGRFRTVVMRNDGGVFSVEQALDPVAWSAMDWGDYDGDGDPDLILTGGRISRSYTIEGSTTLYRNDSGQFGRVDVDFPGVFYGGAAWGDVDQDGDLDLALTGLGTFFGSPIGVVLENRSGAFLMLATLPGAFGGTISMVDVDDDDDLDIVLSGQDASASGFVRVFVNVSRIVNHAPLEPTGLGSTTQGRSVTLGWSAGSDAATSGVSLGYEVRVGSAPGLGDVMPALADPTTGKRVVSQRGNAGQSTTLELRDLPDGTYTWTVQAIDGSFRGSTFAPEAQFAIAGGKAGSTAGEHADLPERFEVGNAYPNPGFGGTRVDLELPAAGRVTVEVFDMRGRSVAVAHDGVLGAGRHTLAWDSLDREGSRARSGMYAIVVRSGTLRASRFVAVLHP